MPSGTNQAAFRRSFLVGPLLVMALVIAGCGGAPGQSATPTKTPSAISVAVRPVEKTTISTTSSYTGNVQSVSEVNVLSRQPGRIVAMPIDVGSKVQKGDVIVELDHVILDLSLEQAQAQLQVAQAKLATIQAGPRDETVKQAEIALDTERAKYQAMLNGSRVEQIAQARLTIDSAQQRLDALQHPRKESVAQAQASVDAAQQKLATIQAGAKPDSVSQVQATLDQAQARLDALQNGLRPESVQTLQLAISQAKNALHAAQANRDGVCGNKSVAGYLCDAGQAQVEAAQTAVDQAAASLKAQTAPPTKTDLQQAQAAVDQAKAALKLAQQPYTPQDVQQAQDAVTTAQQQLALAQQPSTAQDIKQAQNAVAQARQALLQTQRPYTAEDLRQAKNAVDTVALQLALTQKPYTDQDLLTAQAGVAQARAQVDQAAQAVKDAVVTAPMSGVVTQKSLTEGELASPSTSIATIATPDVKVSVPVEETQIANLKLGQDASLSGAALTNQRVSGKVTSIAPTGDAKNRTFLVDIKPDAASGTLLPGMFVNVAIDVMRHTDVLAVPKAAVVQRGNNPYVFVVEDNVAKQTPVTVGLMGETMVEIASGVTLTSAVVVQGQQDLADGDKVAIAATPQTSASIVIATH